MGELVLDRRTGRTGIYMDTIGGEHYLRPETGGREWTAEPHQVDPAPGPGDSAEYDLLRRFRQNAGKRQHSDRRNPPG
ncbi:hypothetical protein [Streptomyces sp. CBMA156]|uniref:hypothetical protein n=1 Tax=Streptomyces sp. CBMA156 TaxID=1930280 RepID=UPI001661D825|nr:hypothetical protein [Streptomyces sp. CBMA156]